MYLLMIHLSVLACMHTFLRLKLKIKNEMNGACSMSGGGERCIQGFVGET